MLRCCDGGGCHGLHCRLSSLLRKVGGADGAPPPKKNTCTGSKAPQFGLLSVASKAAGCGWFSGGIAGGAVSVGGCFFMAPCGFACFASKSGASQCATAQCPSLSLFLLTNSSPFPFFHPSPSPHRVCLFAWFTHQHKNPAGRDRPPMLEGDVTRHVKVSRVPTMGSDAKEDGKVWRPTRLAR